MVLAWIWRENAPRPAVSHNGPRDAPSSVFSVSDRLGLKKPEITSIPDERTKQYYAKGPCAHMVEEAARIWVEYLERKNGICDIISQDIVSFSSKIIPSVI